MLPSPGSPARRPALVLFAVLLAIGLGWALLRARRAGPAPEPGLPAAGAPATASPAAAYPRPAVEEDAYPGAAVAAEDAAAEPIAAMPVTGGLADSAPAPIDPGPGGEADGVFALLDGELPARDPARLARELGRLTGPAPSPTPADLREGATARFWLHDINSSEYRQVEARLAVVTAHAYGWLQTDQTVDEVALRAGVEAFSDRVYPAVRAVFGAEASPGIDGDARVHILHHQPIAGVAGYFYSVDEQPPAVDAHSNAREMFYINLDAFTPGSPDYLALLAHEFQHMIHWSHDPSESVWLNEGLSELAPHLAGLGVQSGRLYLSRPDTPLREWTSDPGANGEHYAAAFALAAYLRRRYGDAFLGRLVAQEANGARAIAATAAELDPARPRFEDLFLDWTVANLLPEDLAGRLPPRYRQDAAVDLRVDPEALPAFPLKADVSPYGADYWDLTSQVRRGALDLRFQGDPRVPLLADAQEQAGPVWWSGRDENMASSLRLDLAPAEGALLEGRLWYQLEEGWDYAYLQASTDGGRRWRNLPIAGSRAEDPNGNNLGQGLTGASAGWEDWRLDLGPYAGRSLALRWLVLTDDAVSESGLALADTRLSLPAPGGARRLVPLPEDDPAWHADGWVRLPLLLPQRWGLQLVARSHSALAVRRFAADAAGAADLRLEDIPDDATVTLVVSALTPGTRSPAGYALAEGAGAGR